MSTAMPPNPRATKIARAIAVQREWRESKASQFPNDLRNVQSAMGLSQLEALLRDLPDDDPRIEAIWEAANDSADDLDTIVLGEESNRDLGRFRFDLRVNESLHDGLVSLIGALRTEDNKNREVRRCELDRRIAELENRPRGRRGTNVTQISTEQNHRIEVEVTDENENLIKQAFRGRWVVTDMYPDDPTMDAGWHISVALTEKGNLAVYWAKTDGEKATLEVFESFDELRDGDKAPPDNILAAVANAIGKEYVQELDI